MKISIPEPCHENWQNMLPSDKGRFCLNCQKEVVDFSVMTKHEIVAYFKSLPSNVCGRFKESQLTDISSELSAVNTKLSLKPWWMAASLFVFAKISIAQSNNMIVDIVKAKQETLYSMKFNVTKNNTIKPEYVVKGKVVDKKTGEPLPFVNVAVDTLKIGTPTDFDGCFTLKVPENTLDSVIISFRYLGYENYDTIINSDAKMLVKLIEGEFIMGEGSMVVPRDELIMVGSVMTVPEDEIMVSGGISYSSSISPSIWRRIGNFFARPFRRRY